jgi:ABC transporter ATM
VREYDKSLVRFEKASLHTATSLALLNVGQGAIFSVALTAMMWMASQGVLSGTVVHARCIIRLLISFSRCLDGG